MCAVRAICGQQLHAPQSHAIRGLEPHLRANVQNQRFAEIFANCNKYSHPQMRMVNLIYGVFFKKLHNCTQITLQPSNHAV